MRTSRREMKAEIRGMRQGKQGVRQAGTAEQCGHAEFGIYDAGRQRNEDKQKRGMTAGRGIEG
jgi:hypothetical protein